MDSLFGLGWREAINKTKIAPLMGLLVAQTVKYPPAMWETWVWSLGQEDPLEEGMATHSSILAWRIPWTEEPGVLQSMGSHRVRHNFHRAAALRKIRNKQATVLHGYPKNQGMLFRTFIKSEKAITESELMPAINSHEPWGAQGHYHLKISQKVKERHPLHFDNNHGDPEHSTCSLERHLSVTRWEATWRFCWLVPWHASTAGCNSSLSNLGDTP